MHAPTTRSRATLRALVVAALVPLAPASRAADVASSTVHVVLTGGADAGTYDAHATRGGCSYGLAGPDAWGEQYSDAKGARGLSSVQMIIPGGKAAAAGTTAFNVTVTIGGLFQGRSYAIDTREGHTKGSGRVTVAEHGAGATYTVDGTTSDGVKLHGTVTCESVTRMP